jgi:acetylornithine/N-succinyldiaminopimelate aminotransferase
MKKFGPFLDLGLAATTPYPMDIKIESADGVWLKRHGGKNLFDAISGIGVSNFGHGNEDILKALHAQIDLNLHTMVYGEFRHDSTLMAASLLTSFLPENLDTVYFVNSGAEAVEGALKLAKRVTGRSRMIGCTGGYHGNTHGALSVSSNAERKASFLPLLPEVSLIEFNCQNSLNSIDATVACVIVETIQGDAGVVIPTQAWISALREKCTTTGTMLILDEIQCGMGRCGAPFAFTEYNITPDILCVGKALGGGMPIGAFVSSRENISLLSHSPILGHITTFGGHPVATAGSGAALNLLKNIDWTAIERRGAAWEAQLTAHPLVKQVRRKGYFFAVEMESEEFVTKAIMRGLEVGVLLFWFLSIPNAFRLQPPLTMTDEEAEVGIALIISALEV